MHYTHACKNLLMGWMRISIVATTHASHLFFDLSSETVTGLNSACHKEDWHVATFLSGEGMLLLTSGTQPVEVILGSLSLSKWKPSPESAICWLHKHGVSYQFASWISQSIFQASLLVILFRYFNICCSVKPKVQHRASWSKAYCNTH